MAFFGGSGGGLDVAYTMETPTGDIDGVNDEFVFTSAPVFITYQGVVQNGGDYTLNGVTATFFVPPVSGTVLGMVTA
jgi:hypothetical protein